jgi:hypothetical protein
MPSDLLASVNWRTSSQWTGASLFPPVPPSIAVALKLSRRKLAYPVTRLAARAAPSDDIIALLAEAKGRVG